MIRSAPRVLMVTPTQTNPAVQGNSARILAFGRELKRRGFEVEVLYYVLDDWSPTIENLMRQEWSDLHVVNPRPHADQSYAAFWGLDDWCADELIQRVRSLCKQKHYDAVVVNYVWLSACLKAVDQPLRLLDTHDIFGDRARLALEAGLEPSWYFTSLEEETRGLDRADVAIAIQDEERQLLASRTKAVVMTVGHPVHAQFALDRPQVSQEGPFGYFASGNPWNMASIRALDAELARVSPSLEWVMAGSICRQPMQLRTHPRILGMLDEPNDFYELAACVINPMTAGTGLKIKTVEALAYGRPVLGTTEAFRGMTTYHAAQAASDVPDLARVMREYIRTPALRREISISSMNTYVDYMQATQKSYDDLAQMIRQA